MKSVMDNWEDITVISGPVSMFLYEYNNKKYYFFGDKHHSRETKCQDKGYKCDSFDYSFTNVKSIGSNCTQMGVLLHNWFIYNNDHNIKTDFYLESFYTKENKRFDDEEYIQIINQRRENPEQMKRYDAPFENKSWLAIVRYIMAPCFIREKENCPYYPNVHSHYIDVRSLITNGYYSHVNPLDLIDIIGFLNYYYKEDDNMTMWIPPKLKVVLSVRESILALLSMILFNYKDLILAMLLPYDFELYISNLRDKTDTLSPIVQPIYISMLNQMLEFSVIRNVNGKNIRMYKVAAELYKLSLENNILSNNIIKYILSTIDRNALNIQKQYTNDVNRLLDTFENNIEDFTITNNNLSKQGLFDLRQFVLKYRKKLMILSTLTMDAYTLARMFIQKDSDEIIVFAGAVHINHYSTFFNKYLNVIPSIKSPYKNERCVIVDDLPLYLNANEHRMYVINKQNLNKQNHNKQNLNSSSLKNPMIQMKRTTQPTNQVLKADDFYIY